MKTYVVDEKVIGTSLLIVGNGFDCSLKAKTKYEDFYSFLESAFNSSSFSDFVNKVDGQYSQEDLKSFFELLINQKELNYFINYFISYKKAFDCWVDFESELERIIVSFDQLLTVLKDSEKIRYNGYDLYIKISDNANLQSIIFNYPNNRFFDSDIASKELFSFSIKGANMENYKSMYKGIDDFIQSFPRELYKDLSIFSKLFSIYLKIIRNDVNYSVSHSFIKDCKIAINYNYTDFLEHYYLRNNCTLNEIIYVNGKCDWNNANDKIVFGIDSSVSIKNKEFFIFTKTAQRSIKNTDIKRIANILRLYKIKRIIVFGHSLSTADKNSLRNIFVDKKKSFEEWAKIEIYCYDENAKMSIASNLEKILELEQYEELQFNDMLELKDV